MNKQSKRKISSPKPTSVNPASQVSKAQPTESAKSFTVWIFPLILFGFAMLLYSNTFQHRFVLDDHGIIKNNKITKAPVSWENTKLIFSTPLRKGDFSDLENSLYRPVVKLFFNIQWNLFDGDPHRFHVINVLWYALTGVLLFFILYDIFQKKWVLPFLISFLFLAHPIHTEVVANVKSSDEILSLLGILIALRGLQLYFAKQKMIYFVLAVLGFLMGSFSKESTIVALGIFPLFMYFFTQSDIKKNAIFSSVFGVCSALFLWCRHKSLSGYPESPATSAMDNYLVLCENGVERFTSAVNTLGLYVKTFFIPHPLSCDYSYSSLMPVGAGDLGFLASFILFVGLFVYAMLQLKFKNPLSFGILWFFISVSIVSNVFFLIGTSFGERLLYTPSLGLCIAFVVLLAKYFDKSEDGSGSIMSQVSKSPVLFAVVIGLSLVYSFKTFSRNKDWKSDFALFSRDINYFPNSTHLLFYMGNHLSSTERKEVLGYELPALGYTPQQIEDSVKRESAKSIDYFTRSMRIYPALPSDGYNQLGKAYYNNGYIDSADKYYKKALIEDSTNAIFTNNVGTVYYITGQQMVIKGRNLAAAGKNDSAMYFYQLGTQKILDSKNYFLKAHLKDTTEADFSNNVGCVYGDTQRPDSAIYWFKKAHMADSLDLTSINYLNITYRNKGDIAMADYYKAKYEQIKMLKQQLNSQ